jgi:renalase
MKSVAIIGAGIAGSVCAYWCRHYGHSVTLFDKSRGPGGRASTRRWSDAYGIDMGVPYIVSDDIPDDVRPFLNAAITAGSACPWRMIQHNNGQIMGIDTIIGSPKMSQLVRFFVNDVPIVTQYRVTQIQSQKGKWVVAAGDDWYSDRFDQVVLAIPAPQIPDIQGVPDTIRSQAQQMAWSAVNTVLLQTNRPVWSGDYDEDVWQGDVIQTVIADYKKPNRWQGGYTYAIHSTYKWATQSFDTDHPDTITATLLAGIRDRYAVTEADCVAHHVHRWKYAQVLGNNDYVTAAPGGVYACWGMQGTFCGSLMAGYYAAQEIA